MRLDNRIILILITAFTLLVFPAAAFTTGPLRIILSFLLVIFSPGFTLLSALFPKRDGISAVERVASSFGISIAVVSLIGFILNFTPWGIRPVPFLLSVAAFIMACCMIGFVRQQLLPEQLRFGIVIKINGSGWKELSRLQKSMPVMGLMAVIAMIFFVVCLAVSLPLGQNPSEFYILNAAGKADNYPRQIKAGDVFSVNAVVVNNESQSADFKVLVINAGTVISEIDTSSLQPGEKWEAKVSLLLKTAGQNQKIEFYLYKEGQNEPYFNEPLNIYIDVAN